MIMLGTLGYNFWIYSSDVWLPHMRTEKIINELQHVTRVLATDVPYFEIPERVFVEKEDGWIQRHNLLLPHPEGKGIFIDLMVHYPLLGKPYTITGELTEAMIMESCKAKFSGYPFNQYGISKIFNPHHHELGWREIVGDEEALRILAYHRLNDTLGALALIGARYGALPACLLRSHMGNHALDVRMSQQVSKIIQTKAATDGTLLCSFREPYCLGREVF